MLAELSAQLSIIFQSIAMHFKAMLIFIAVFWAAQLINVCSGKWFNNFGIIPRRIRGLVGIVVSPLLHADFGHLFFNTIPLFVLSCLLIINGWPEFIAVTVIVVIGGGILTWLFGRNAIHIGASGMVMGYWGYLLVNAIYHFSIMTIILAALCLYYFAGLYINLLPTDKTASWEGHVFGFIAGVAAVYILPIVPLVAWITALLN